MKKIRKKKILDVQVNLMPLSLLTKMFL